MQLEREIEELRGLVQQLREEVTQLQGELVQLRAENGRLVVENGRLREEHGRLTAENAALRATIEGGRERKAQDLPLSSPTALSARKRAASGGRRNIIKRGGWSSQRA